MFFPDLLDVEETADPESEVHVDGSASDRLVDGASDGLVDGTSDRLVDGTSDGPSNGLVDGTSDGLLDGTSDGLVVGEIIRGFPRRFGIDGSSAERRMLTR
jgi:hypothetical protein